MDIASIVRRLRQTERTLFGINAVLTALLVVCAGAFLTFPDVLSSRPATPRSGTEFSGKTDSVTTTEVSARTLGKAPFRTMRIQAPKVVDELSAFVLNGISSRGGETRAYVRDTKQKRMLTKRVGDSLGSYEIADIGPEGISLTKGGQTIVLSRR